MSAYNKQLEPNWLAPAMPDDMLERAVEVFQIPSTKHDEKSMTLYLIDKFKEYKVKYKIDGYGNILAERGEGLRACFCAHLDTVHMYRTGFNIRRDTPEEYNRTYLYAVDNTDVRVGIGGDDKCGVFVCLELLRTMENIKVVFFSQEESGGAGSDGISLDYFKDCMFLGGVDRWNGHDFVTNYNGDPTVSKAFKSAIKEMLEKYEYKPASGMFTDAFNVQGRQLGISCFNMSCGYYSHHSTTEYVDTNELYHSLLLAQELCTLTKRYEYQIPVSTYKGSTYHGSDWKYHKNKWDDDYKWGKKDNDKINWKSFSNETLPSVLTLSNGWLYNTHTLQYERMKDGKMQRGCYTYDTVLKKYTWVLEEADLEEETTEKDRLCADCGVELFSTETKYCWTCVRKNKKRCVTCNIELLYWEEDYCSMCKTSHAPAISERSDEYLYD